MILPNTNFVLQILPNLPRIVIHIWRLINRHGCHQFGGRWWPSPYQFFCIIQMFKPVSCGNWILILSSLSVNIPWVLSIFLVLNIPSTPISCLFVNSPILSIVLPGLVLILSTALVVVIVGAGQGVKLKAGIYELRCIQCCDFQWRFCASVGSSSKDRWELRWKVEIMPVLSKGGLLEPGLMDFLLFVNLLIDRTCLQNQRMKFRFP